MNNILCRQIETRRDLCVSRQFRMPLFLNDLIAIKTQLNARSGSENIAYLLLYFAVVRLNDKTDPVTGLPNRNAFNTVFFHRQKPCRTIVFFDLNHLKQYNDTYGHSTGDSYLRAFALTMQEKLTSYGKLYRTGGDEFCFLSDHKAEELKKILDQIRKNGRSNPLYGDYPLDFAFGVSEKKTDETNEALYMRADSLMYLDKRRMKENARSDTDERWN